MTLSPAAILTDRELRALLAACRTRAHAHARRDHALFALLANTGVRPGEALALRVGDLWLSDHEPRIRVRRLKKRRELGTIDDLVISRAMGRTLRVYLAHVYTGFASRAVVDHVVASNPLVFPIKLRNAERLFKTYLRLAGLPSSIRLYALRHTAGTRLWRASRDLLVVKRQLGHADTRTTEVYTHVDPERVRAMAELAGSET